MTDWSSFGVDPNITIFQNRSYFSIGENVTFNERLVPSILSINVNATNATANSVSYPLSSLSFGYVNYTSTYGL